MPKPNPPSMVDINNVTPKALSPDAQQVVEDPILPDVQSSHANAGHKRSILALDALQVPIALPLEADDFGYQIPRNAQLEDLKVVIEKVWDNYEGAEAGEITYVDVYFDYIPGISPATTAQLVWPYDPDEEFPLSLSIPQSYLNVPGRHVLSYIVTLDGNLSPPSDPVVIDLDKLAPNQGAAWRRLQFPVDTIDESYLDDPVNNDQVVATIERWNDIKLKDVASGHWEALGDPDTDAVSWVTIEARHLGANPDPIELAFKGDDIRNKGDGEFFPYYILNDKVGNVGDKSLKVSIEVKLDSTPVRLNPPRVPQAADGLIDLEDARAAGGVYMLIDDILGMPGDVLHFYWDLQDLGRHPIGDPQSWPIRVPVSWEALSHGGTELARQTVRVHYTWQRGGAPEKPSTPAFVAVDLTVAGPVNPGNPDPINVFLDQVTIKGVTGDNIITSADSGAAVRAVVPLYADPLPGQVLELMWAAHPAAADSYTVLDGDTEGKEVEFFIPWALVEPLGNAVVPASYWTFNGVNRQRAPDTSVNVNVIPISGLKPVEFPDVSYQPGPGAGFVNCSTRPWLGVRVKIPGDPERLALDDKIELSWVGHAGTTNTAPVIPETVDLFTHTLTAEEALNGYIFTVPFDPYVKLPGLIKPDEGSTSPANGCAVVRYRLIKAQGGGGNSGGKLLPISLIRPNSPPCLGDD